MHLMSSALSIPFILCFIVGRVDSIPVPAGSGDGAPARYGPVRATWHKTIHGGAYTPFPKAAPLTAHEDIEIDDDPEIETTKQVQNTIVLASQKALFLWDSRHYKGTLAVSGQTFVCSRADRSIVPDKVPYWRFSGCEGGGHCPPEEPCYGHDEGHEYVITSSAMNAQIFIPKLELGKFKTHGKQQEHDDSSDQHHDQYQGWHAY
ncbi:hypothetical protein F5878DRAFT_633097 [Lentinula raphanica]|uniref:Uncharacterized protein n=1 Tax=Lentinula raphanica TaxID=153919 RepID=A0AA38NZ40_9AGAR|nr:hypothetical protein F5878DRAFT_633097 [Lentinula raphanica]